MKVNPRNLRMISFFRPGVPRSERVFRRTTNGFRLDFGGVREEAEGFWTSEDQEDLINSDFWMDAPFFSFERLEKAMVEDYLNWKIPAQHLNPNYGVSPPDPKSRFKTLEVLGGEILSAKTRNGRHVKAHFDQPYTSAPTTFSGVPEIAIPNFKRVSSLTAILPAKDGVGGVSLVYLPYYHTMPDGTSRLRFGTDEPLISDLETVIEHLQLVFMLWIRESESEYTCRMPKIRLRAKLRDNNDGDYLGGALW